MKRIDYYFGISLISFILCIGLCHKEITSIEGYVYFLSHESNWILEISLIALVSLIVFFVFIVLQEYKHIRKKDSSSNDNDD